MDLGQIWQMVQGVLPAGVVVVVGYVLAGLGTLVVLGYSYVKLTPSQDDDAWWAKMEELPILGAILKGLVKFSPVQRKE